MTEYKKAPKGRKVLALGNALCREYKPILHAPRSVVKNGVATSWGITDGLMFNNENACSGTSPLSKGVAKPGDLALTHHDNEISILSDWPITTEKSPFNSPFDEGDERLRQFSFGITILIR